MIGDVLCRDFLHFSAATAAKLGDWLGHYNFGLKELQTSEIESYVLLS